jgi:predicted dehydrogenase
VYNSYEALAASQEVDVIYIATPHSFHFENSLLCLSNRKAVLCEKPSALTLRQTSEIISVARQQNTFWMEAMWTGFLPHFIKTKAMIAEGMIGDIASIRADFGFRPKPPVPARLFDLSLGGGSLMDIGIYPVFLALNLLGKPLAIDAVMQPASTGADEQCAITFHYKNALAQLFSTNASNTATEADISGTDGRIRLTSRFHEPSSQIEFFSGRADTKQVVEVDREDGFGYQYEAAHVADCIRNGLTESDVMKFDDSLLLMQTLEAIRFKAGIFYPADNMPV